MAATRYEYQEIEFLRTAAELERLRFRAMSAPDESELRQLAVSAEAVISVENQGWMVKLGEEPVTPQ